MTDIYLPISLSTHKEVDTPQNSLSKIPSLFTDNQFILCNLNDITVKAHFGMYDVFRSTFCLRC